MEIRLTNQEREILLKELKDAELKHISDFINVILLASEGYSIAEISKILHRSQMHMKSYINRFLKDGIAIFQSTKEHDSIKFTFNVRKHGWIDFLIEFDDVSIKIKLSSVFDPFMDLLKWIMDIYKGDQATQLSIDEEGRFKYIECIPMPHKILKIYNLNIMSSKSDRKGYRTTKTISQEVLLNQLYNAFYKLSEDAKDISWSSSYNLSEYIADTIEQINIKK